VKVDELEITVRENILTLRGRTAIAVPQGARMIWSGMAGEEFGEQDLLAPLAAQSAVALRLDPALSGQAHVQADP
jgi:hypothetical protein